MFGALRFLLAYLVIVSHLVGTPYVAHLGFYAVRGFFVLSGLMMTSALNEVYAFDGVRFWTNRALRLLPAYYLVCLLTLVAIAVAPTRAADFQRFWHEVPGLTDLAANAAVLPLQLSYTSFSLIPPFWSVAVEIDMYLLLFLIVSRRMEWAVLALVAGLSFQVAWACCSFDWWFNYFTAPAAVLPFSVGAVLYFLRRRGVPMAAPWLAVAALVAWFCNMVAGGSLLPGSYIFGDGFFFDTICFAIVVSGLSGLSAKNVSPVVARIDRTLGEWSYFAFLAQWLCAFIAANALPGLAQRGWMLLLATTPLVLIASAGLAALNRTWLEPLRDKVRGHFGPFRHFAPGVLAGEAQH
jgi:peptidoglycan/LPS O-acetylase OafA/YrhL